jgi:hypothetical protein
VTLAGVGFLVMAFIQLIKDLTPARQRYQRFRLRQYLIKGYEAVEEHAPSKDDLQSVTSDIVDLAAAGDAGALFSLPVEKLAGQLAVAMRSALEYPSDRAILLKIMARHATEDVDVVVKAGRTPRPESEKTENGQPKGEEPWMAFEYADDPGVIEARTRVSDEIQRSLDGLQILFAHKWQLLLKILSVAFGGAFILVSLLFFMPHNIWGDFRWVVWLVLAVIGGFLAPVAHDLMAALQSVRRLGRE